MHRKMIRWIITILCAATHTILFSAGLGSLRQLVDKLQTLVHTPPRNNTLLT
jgi:hypothetical protein